MQARLYWQAAGAELYVQLTENDQSGEPISTPTPDPGPAPASMVKRLPQRSTPRRPTVGDPFGPRHDCFETNYNRFVVPNGARVLEEGIDNMGNVLAVSQPETVLRDLREQLDDPKATNGHYEVAQQPLPDGRSVWQLTGSVDGGGGACTITSSPDGTALLVVTHSD